jgi:hypothetical protein
MVSVLKLDADSPRSTDVLDLDREGKLDLTVQDFIGQRVAFLGSSGTGKTNSVALILEKVLPFMPVVIFDQHNEFWGLCERYELLRVGKSPESQIPAGPEQAIRIAEISHSKRLSVLVEMLEMTEEERLDFVHQFCAKVWALNKIPKLPYGVVLEEAQNFIPESKSLSPALRLLKQFALEGRKFGFSIFLSSQRTAEVNKTILGQCRVAFLHGVDIYNDVQAYAGMLPFTLAETKKIALNLGTGDCIVKVKRTGPAQYHHPVHMRQRETFHVGDTPTLDHEAAPPLGTLSPALVDELRQAMAAEPEAPKPDTTNFSPEWEVLARENESLKQQLAERDAEIARLKAQVQKWDTSGTIKPPSEVTGPRIAQELAGAPMSSTVEPPQLPTIAVSLPSAPDPEWDGRSELATKRAQSRQRSQFEAMMADIKRMNALHRRILVYLTQREHIEVEEKPLARNLGYSLSNLEKHRPVDLQKLGLIHRRLNPKRTEYIYRSTARGRLKELYPDLDTDVLVRQICSLEKV